MPARKEEVKHAKEEGIQIITLTKPLEFKGNDDGWLQSVQLIKMELCHPDASGRRTPIPVKDSEHEINVDVAIVAIGNGSNPVIQKTTPDLLFSNKGNIVVDPETMKTSRPGVFAGGDIVTGGATVILAMGAGRKAAGSIHNYLSSS